MRSRVEIKTKTFLLDVEVTLYFFCRDILNNSWWCLRFSRFRPCWRQQWRYLDLRSAR